MTITVLKLRELPDSLETLDLGGRRLPAGTKLPDSLRWLDLGGGRLPAGTKLPAGCAVIGENGR